MLISFLNCTNAQTSRHTSIHIHTIALVLTHAVYSQAAIILRLRHHNCTFFLAHLSEKMVISSMTMVSSPCSKYWQIKVSNDNDNDSSSKAKMSSSSVSCQLAALCHIKQPSAVSLVFYRRNLKENDKMVQCNTCVVFWQTSWIASKANNRESLLLRCAPKSKK